MREPIDDVADRLIAELDNLPPERAELLQAFMSMATGAFAMMHPDDVKTAIRMLKECDECPRSPSANPNN